MIWPKPSHSPVTSNSHGTLPLILILHLTFLSLPPLCFPLVPKPHLSSHIPDLPTYLCIYHQWYCCIFAVTTTTNSTKLANIRCETWYFRYTVNHLRLSSTCILCYLQKKLEDSQRKYDDLAKRFNILQDFVFSNFGCTPEAATTYSTAVAVPSPTTITPPPPMPSPGHREVYHTQKWNTKHH